MEAAARRERPHKLVLREVEGVVRLVEEHAAAVAHHGKAGEPAAEVRDVAGGDLDALGAPGGPGSEDDVLGLLVADPLLAGQRRAGLPRGGAGGKKRRGVDDLSRGQDVAQGAGHLAGREHRRVLDLTRDVGYAPRRQLGVDGHVRVPAHQATEKRGDGQRRLRSEHEHRPAAGNLSVEPARDPAGRAPQIAVRRLPFRRREERRRVGRFFRLAPNGAEQHVCVVLQEIRPH